MCWCVVQSPGTVLVWHAWKILPELALQYSASWLPWRICSLMPWCPFTFVSPAWVVMPYFSVYFHLRWHHWNLFRDRSFYSLLSPRLSVPFFELLVPYFVLWLSFILVFPHLRLWALRDVRESKFTKTFIVLNAEPGNIATKQNTA